ncbi:MAG: S-layer homology domain-containing protein [Clostridia bacterium]|nr:S-layer homology domain-containing protein [Clostridia bacterium]
MKKISRKAVAFALCGVLAAGVVTGAALLFGKKEAASAVVSAGLQQLADGAYLAASAPVGEQISFTPEWFDGTLSGEAVTSITVTALPPATEGQLLLGHGTVSVGQTVPRDTLSYLCFVPNEGVRESSFSFVPTTESGTRGYSLACSLRVTDAVNCCPSGTKSVTAVSTHASLALIGTLFAEDPEGDALRFEVCSYPENGTLSLDGVTGAFVYTPNEGFAGSDSFTWRVQDACGAFAEAAAVEITVRELATGYVFTDMEHPNTHSAALRLAEKGLMSGETVGGKHYFHPDRTLTRAAFVTVLLQAADIRVPDADNTGFADDAEIPRAMKGAIRYAREKGWLGDAEHFRPNDAITRAEAAKIAAAVLELGAPGYAEAVPDFQAIPVDAADALYAIFEGGYISTMADGTLSPLGALTRGDAARFFARVLDREKS